MGKATVVLLNHRSAWIGSGEAGPTPQLKSLQRIDMSAAVTIEEQSAAILAGLAEQRLSKRNIVLVLGPQHTEYRPFQVPPVGPAELPTIVANLATTQLTKIGEESIVDFVAMPPSNSGSGNSGGTSVFVTATSFQTSLLLQELKTHGVTCDRILPRIVLPNLLRDSGGADVQVMINILASEIDFVATQATQVVMVRSSVIPTDGEDRAKLIGRETARSLAVLSAEFGRTEKMTLAVTGTPEEVAAVTDILAAQDLDARQVVAADFGSLPAELGPSSGSYALMALAALRTDRRPLLDFANPTQPPTDDAAKRRRILVAALAATLLIGLLGLGWLEIRRLDQQLAQLQAEVSTLESEEPANTMTINRVGMINDFLLMDVEPLSILEQLSQQLPYGDQLRVQSLKVNVGRMAQVGSFPVTMTSRLIDEDLAEDYKPTLHAHPLWTFDPVTKLTSISSKHYRSQAVDVFTVAPDFEVIYDRLANAVWKDGDSGEATSAALPPTSGTDGDPATTATADPAPASQSSAEVTTADETESAVEQVPPAGRTDRSSADSSEQADDDESEAESDQRAAEEREQSRREGEASGDAGTERTDTEQQEEGEGDGD